MNKNPKLTHYVSEIDQLLKTFDESHEPTASQKQEIEKAQRIYLLRDKPTSTDPFI